MYRHQLSSHKRFVYLFPVFLIGIVSAYALFFKEAIVYDQGAVPYSYKQFLLEETPGSRILIDSGSNGYYSMNGRIIGDLTGMPVVILCDNGGFSMLDKAKRVLRYGHPGDILILPYEWSHYLFSEFTDIYLEWSKQKLSYYYHALPIVDQLKRAYETPISLVLTQILKGNLWIKDDLYTDIAQLKLFRTTNAVKGPNGKVFGTPKKTNNMDAPCDHAIFGIIGKWETAKEKEPDLSDRFLETISILKKIKDKGIQIIVIPPVVVGDNCYTDCAQFVEILWDKVCVELNKHGIVTFGEPMKFKFEDEDYHDTYYHISSSARDRFSSNLVKELQEVDLLPKNSSIKNRSKWDPAKRLMEKETELISEYISKLLPWEGHEIYINSDNEFPYLFLESGWYPPESSRAWGEGNSSSILFRLNKNNEANRIMVEADYYNGSQETEILLSGESIGKMDFSKAKLITLPTPLSEYALESGFVRLVFRSHDLVSPKSLGYSQDGRPLKLGIKSIQLQFEGRWDGRKIVIGKSDLIKLGQGWHEPESWGCWCKGYESMFSIRVNPLVLSKKMKLNANYYNGSQKTKIWINDIFLGNQNLAEDPIITLPEPISHLSTKEGMIKIRFQSDDLSSPLVLSGANDNRMLKLGLFSIEML
jgi:hypothetical protein